MKKYELTDETIVIGGQILHRIRALRDFAEVKAGDIGGYIENENNIRKIPTNFNKLDNIYGGGLSKGLTIIGANTGLGKTTFALQLADNVAQQPNTKVLFFSLELTKYELVSITDEVKYTGAESGQEEVPAILYEGGSFTNTLTAEEINILATYMVVEWLGQQLASVENTRMKYSGSDFKFTSQANHM